jgi:predicted acetyltransferase
VRVAAGPGWKDGPVPVLELPDPRFHRSFLAAMLEDPGYFAGQGLRREALLAAPAFARYVAGLRADVRPDTPRPPGFVPQTVLWWVAGDELLARVGVRHRLNQRLRTWGGHIGYWTRPSARGRGHATAAFRASLAVAAGLGIDPALLTCDHDNAASRHIIESAGGVFEQRLGEKRLYWVPTRPWVPGAPGGADERASGPV